MAVALTARPARRHPLLRQALVRVATGVLVIWGAATLTFVTLHVMPGDPVQAIVGGDNAAPSPAVVAEVRNEYGFNQPLIAQYVRYLGQLLHGDLGVSYQMHQPVTVVIGQQLGATVQLALTAGITAIALALVVAVLTAKRPRLVRSTASGVELILASTPSFWLGLLLLAVFSYGLHWFPSIGNQGPASLVLPTVMIALPIAAVLSQVLRNALEDVLEQPFIVTARARGLGEAAVRFGHALRHAVTPLITMSGFVIGGLFGGAVIAESLFSRQGLGRILLTAVNSQDMPVVLGIVLLSATVYVVVNIVVDLLYPVIDPRLRGAVT
ncbi:ABC transporter permease [Rathayibacter sp. CAU 1779]